MKSSEILKLLEDENVPYTLYTHPAVFTVDEAEVFMKEQAGGHFKNLLLKDKKNKEKFYLVILKGEKKLNIKALEKTIATKLTFAKAEILESFDTIAGAVSPFVLLEDQENALTLYLDEDFKTYDLVNFHPNDNTVTLGLEMKSFSVFLQKHAREIVWFKA